MNPNVQKAVRKMRPEPRPSSRRRDGPRRSGEKLSEAAHAKATQALSLISIN